MAGKTVMIRKRDPISGQMILMASMAGMIISSGRMMALFIFISGYSIVAGSMYRRVIFFGPEFIKFFKVKVIVLQVQGPFLITYKFYWKYGLPN